MDHLRDVLLKDSLRFAFFQGHTECLWIRGRLSRPAQSALSEDKMLCRWVAPRDMQIAKYRNSCSSVPRSRSGLHCSLVTTSASWLSSICNSCNAPMPEEPVEDISDHQASAQSIERSTFNR